MTAFENYWRASPEVRSSEKLWNGDEVVELAPQLTPDIILLDLAMPVRSGLEVLRLLSEPRNTARVVLLTALIEREQIVEALQLGARGIVLKESTTLEGRSYTLSRLL